MKHSFRENFCLSIKKARAKFLIYKFARMIIGADETLERISSAPKIKPRILISAVFNHVFSQITLQFIAVGFAVSGVILP